MKRPVDILLAGNIPDGALEAIRASEALKNTPPVAVVEPPNQDMVSAMLAASAFQFFPAHTMPREPRGFEGCAPRSRPSVLHRKSKCGFPGCDKEGYKDYCCADHCRQHRRK